MTPKYKRMLTGMLRKEKYARKQHKREWAVYVLRCSDGSLYTGIAKDVAQRLKSHNAGTGAKYTKTRRPVGVVYQQNSMTRPRALSREYAIKRMSKLNKEKLVAT